MIVLAAVVLAAGASTRMGRPKALLQWRGRPFVHHAIEQARAGGAETVVVVQGAEALPAQARPGASLVDNAAWARGPLGSLQIGLQRVQHEAPDAAAVVVLTVDRPHIHATTMRALAAAVAQDPGAVWQPRHQLRRGHPIVYPMDVATRLCALRPPDTPRTLLAQPEIAERRRQFDVDDPAVLENLDRPEDLARLPA